MLYRESMRVLVGGALVLVVGCAGNDEPPVSVEQSSSPQTASQPAQARSEPAAPPAAPSAAPAGEPASANTGAPAAAPAATSTSDAAPIAVEDHRVSGVQVALMDLRRTSGDTVTLRLQFRNTSSSDVSDSVFYSTGIPNQTYLIDGQSKKKYLVVRDAENNPVGAIGTSSTIPAGATYAAWVRFPAPPPEISTVTVVVPGAPPFEDVPIK